jgi:hypothetical protein
MNALMGTGKGQKTRASIIPMHEHHFTLIWSQSSGVRTVDGDPQSRTFGSALRYAGVVLSDRQASLLHDLLGFKLLEVDENELGIVFDLDSPIEAQWIRVKETLTYQQEKRHSKKLQRRNTNSKWLEYLRVLDARECGASWSQIATIFRYKQTNPLTARDTWQQANDLCFNFPY